MRISQQPAFVLHAIAYRESSLLLDILTYEYGRISLIARGVRKHRHPLRALLQPFSPLLVSWQGKTELMTLQIAEPHGVPIQLKGESLLSGFYLNELLVRLLQKSEPQPQLYTIYQHTLLELEREGLQQKYLRLFEKKLLDELGYGFQLQSILAEHFYWFHPEQGFTVCEADKKYSQGSIFSGKSLLDLAAGELENTESLQDAKRLMRIALGALLGTRPLHSRKLFAAASN